MIPTDLIFDFIEISGFMSFPPKKAQRLILNTNRLTTIIGENLDVGDGERNGVGKSAIIDAILYLFFGKSPRVSNQGFLNYVDPGTMFVTGTASRNGVAFRVERGENPSVLRLFEKPADDDRDFRHRDDGKLIFETTKSTKPETTKRVIELVGFDITLSDVLLVNNPSDRSCFFLKTAEDQRNIIERIFGFTVFTEKAEALREARKEETKNLATKESALVATRQANDRVMAQIKLLEEKSTAWAAERDKLAKFLSQQIRSYQKVDWEHELKVLGDIDRLLQEQRDLERDARTYHGNHEAARKRQTLWITQHEEELAEIRGVIKTLKEADASADIKTIQKLERLRHDAKDLAVGIKLARGEADHYRQQHEGEHANRTRIVNQAAAIEKQIMQLNESKCPTCGQDWADTKAHIVHCIGDLDARNAEIAECDKRIKEHKDNFATRTADAERAERQLEKINKDIAALPATTFASADEAAKASAQLEQMITLLKTETEATNPHDSAVAEAKAQVAVLHGKAEKLKANIAKKPPTQFESLNAATMAKQTYDMALNQFDQLQHTENPHQTTIENLRTEVLKEIDETEIKELKNLIEHMSLLIKLLSDRDSPIRTSILHEWLPELNERMNKYLEFLELPHRIVFDANMTATFTHNKRELGFGNLSTGQRLRVWLATNMAFREIFELINYNINLFFVDEVLDKGMSPRGAEVSYQLLQQMVDQNKSLFLITHRAELTDLADHTLTISLENGLSTITN